MDIYADLVTHVVQVMKLLRVFFFSLQELLVKSHLI